MYSAILAISAHGNYPVPLGQKNSKSENVFRKNFHDLALRWMATKLNTIEHNYKMEM